MNLIFNIILLVLLIGMAISTSKQWINSDKEIPFEDIRKQQIILNTKVVVTLLIAFLLAFNLF